jgi:hypothetical protein
MSSDDELRADIEKAVDRMRTLRDEARLKIHLGSMDARDAWQQLQPTLLEAERVAGSASRAALDTVERAVKALSDLVFSL